MKPTVNGLKIYRSKRRGQALVEFPLLLIPLLLIVGGIVDFGLFFYFKNTVANAARAVVRQAVLTQIISTAALLKANVSRYLRKQLPLFKLEVRSNNFFYAVQHSLYNCIYVEVHKTGL